MEERLQKYMARCGVDSRRKCEELIAQGMVEVNGEVVREPGVKIDPARDRIKVGGKVLRTEKPAYYLHYKVRGVTTTVSDDLGRKTVMDCLPDIRERVYPVGRLDKESEGLLVLTNDGEMANYLTHPAFGVRKTYRVVAEGRIEADVLRALAEKGMRLGPVLVKPSGVELVRYDNDNTVVLISVAEGINREVRRIFAALGHEVKKLLRIQTGPLSLAGMKRGATRPITPKELSTLRKAMQGVDISEAEALFPPGTAKERKPTGPRGRPRRVKAPRQGKPDPAAASGAPAGERPFRSASPGAKSSRGVPAGAKPSRGAPAGAKPSRGMSASAKPSRGAPAGAKPSRGRGKVVVDDWKKTVKTGSQANSRRPRGASDDASAPAKPLRTLRPVKNTATKIADKPKPKPAPAPRAVRHPLAPPRTAATGDAKKKSTNGKRIPSPRGKNKKR